MCFVVVSVSGVVFQIHPLIDLPLSICEGFHVSSAYIYELRTVVSDTYEVESFLVSENGFEGATVMKQQGYGGVV